MRRFLLKYLCANLAFFAPAAYFSFVVDPNISGDIGKLGMIPFGKDYAGLCIANYDRRQVENASVEDIYSLDSLQCFSIITIGDSFSQQHENGYQWKLSSLAKSRIANIPQNRVFNIVETYVALMNEGVFNEGQTVILESVERAFVQRFANINFDTRFQNSNVQEGDNMSMVKSPFLNRFFSWIRLSCGYNLPVKRYHLSKTCFTHPLFSDEVFIYNSPKIGDGDLLWELNTDDEYSKVANNLNKLFELAKERKISLLILIAADKYDTYSIWISDEHDDNPTFSRIPNNPNVFITKYCLQDAISNDVMDVYKLNDTHWSVIGADIVADALFLMMNERGLLPNQHEFYEGNKLSSSQPIDIR